MAMPIDALMKTGFWSRSNARPARGRCSRRVARRPRCSSSPAARRIRRRPCAPPCRRCAIRFPAARPRPAAAVADGVAERVVDVFEIVQIHVQQRQLAAVRAGLAMRLAQPLAEQRAVRQRGQRIVAGQIGQAGLGPRADRHFLLQRGVGDLEVGFRHQRFGRLALCLLPGGDQRGLGNMAFHQMAGPLAITGERRTCRADDHSVVSHSHS